MRRKEYDHRVAALKSRFPHLFAGPQNGHSFYPGWLGILNELCAGLDDALAGSERRDVHFKHIKEKFGGLRADLSIAPPRLDAAAGDGTRSSRPPGTAQSCLSISDRTAPFVRAAETRSYATCIFCGAPGVLRRDRSRVLTLCDGHAPFDHRDLDVAFESMTSECARPTGWAEAVGLLRLGAFELRDPGVLFLGVLPPEAGGPYRIVLRLAATALWSAGDVQHAAARLIRWPVRSVPLAVGAAAPEGIRWIVGGAE